MWITPDVNEIPAEQIQKLPKWAQAHFRQLEAQRNIAVRALNAYLDTQSESPFRYWEYLGIGGAPSYKTKFIQTDKIEVHWAGVELTVLIRRDVQELDLQWCKAQDRIGEVAFIPKSLCAAVIKTKENMR